MDSSTTQTTTPSKGLATEFGTWPLEDIKLQHVTDIRFAFDTLLEKVTAVTPPGNARYLALVKTKLEEACMFAVKGIAKP